MFSIKNLLKRFFPNTYTSIHQDGERKATKEIKEFDTKENDYLILQKRRNLESHYVISVGDDGTIVIGKIISWLKKSDLIPIVSDLISNKEVICFGITKKYHPLLLNTIMSMDSKIAYVLMSNWQDWDSLDSSSPDDYLSGTVIDKLVHHNLIVSSDIN